VESDLDSGKLEQGGAWSDSGAYAYADVGYFGLTHSLLAWARCHLWAADNQVPMIAPSWLRVRGRIGPWLRREPDKRQYQLLFRFPDYITGMRRLALLATRERIAANEKFAAPFLTSVYASAVFVHPNGQHAALLHPATHPAPDECSPSEQLCYGRGALLAAM